MIGTVAQRREERVAAIVAAAWKLAGTHGIGGLSLHALAREVGIRQPSLYSYFESKSALYDAMFADGNRRLLERLDNLKLPSDPRAVLKVWMRAFVNFAVEDVARYLLLFQRPIPDFAPSPESYASAQDVLARSVEVMNAAGFARQGDVDCYVAMIAGLVDAQIANDPTGNRWVRHLNRLTDMYLAEVNERNTR